MAPLDVCRRARLQGLIAAPGSRGAASAQRQAKWQRRVPPRPAPHAHTPFAFLFALARTFLRPPRPQRRRAMGSPKAQRAAAVSRSRGFCSITVALGAGPGRGSAPSLTTGPRRPLLRDAPAPFAASPRLLRCCTAKHPPDALSATHQVLGNFQGSPGPLSCPGLLRLARQGPRSPPLPKKKRTRSHQLIQRRAAAFRCAPDFADKCPGIGGNQGLPRPPPPANLPPSTRSDPRRSLGARASPSRPCSLEIEANNK
ncbi:uncharacterized protein [Callorhinus ursinus]|uniref:uncharacterized protein n=1 Tax=Callorhinus ursinus TaxID=34884 RepID=UPI003CD0452F